MQLAHAAAFLCELKHRRPKKSSDENTRGRVKAFSQILFRKKKGRGC